MLNHWQSPLKQKKKNSQVFLIHCINANFILSPQQNQMDNSFTHTGFIQYDLDVCLQDNTLELTLSITQEKQVKKYKQLLIDDLLAPEVKKQIGTVENLLVVLGKKSNFQVDPLKGKIIVLLKKFEQNAVSEKKIEIQLQFVGEEFKNEEIMESKISEDFGGEMEDLQFPVFDGEEKVVEGFQKEMAIFRIELAEWKKQWEEKKEKIKQMPKKKLNKDFEYQGEMKGGKLDGFGIVIHVSGNWFEGEFKNNCMNGIGIDHWPDGRRHEGSFQDGKINGRGVRYLVNGDWLQGEWKDHKPHGRVIYHYANGKVEEQKYKNGERIDKK